MQPRLTYSMQPLEYLKVASEYEKGARTSPVSTRVAIVTNFTDDVLKKILTGVMVLEGVTPNIYQVPFKQYALALKAPTSPLFAHTPDVTYFFFDVNPYLPSEFLADNHGDEVLGDIANYCSTVQGEVVLHTLSTPTSVQHSRLLRTSELIGLVEAYNTQIRRIAEEHRNVSLIDTDALVRALGERQVRDFRGMYAFSQPFSTDFLLQVAREWMTTIRPLRGKVHKCIVLDLDNVLWGGVVGEVGPLGVALGQEYPGNAYQQFQRVLLELHNRGVILAMNSRNNEADVDEVFEKNKQMVLQKSHFSYGVVNWKTKAENLSVIAKELNIGLDSLIFIDDDPVNRDMVRQQLPEVCVPEWSMPPEEYVSALLNLDVFEARASTKEDAERGNMYAAEQERKRVQAEVPTLQEYLKTLGMVVEISTNNTEHLPRLAQLTQKTNQFNLSTRRSTEQELTRWIDEGAFVYSGEVRDTFGPYGVTVMGICRPLGATDVELTTFLMSCRVMGREVEKAFLRAVVEDLSKKNFTHLRASFIPTKKNMPVSTLLPDMGATEIEEREGGEKVYQFLIREHLEKDVETLPVEVIFRPL